MNQQNQHQKTTKVTPDTTIYNTTTSFRREEDQEEEEGYKGYDNPGYVPTTTNVDHYYNTVISSTENDIYYTTLV